MLLSLLKARALDAPRCVHCSSKRIRVSRREASTLERALGLKEYRCLSCKRHTPLPRELADQVVPPVEPEEPVSAAVLTSDGEGPVATDHAPGVVGEAEGTVEGTPAPRRTRRRRSVVNEPGESAETRARSVTVVIAGQRHNADVMVYVAVGLLVALAAGLLSDDLHHGLIAGTAALLLSASVAYGLATWGRGRTTWGKVRRVLFVGVVPAALIVTALWLVRGASWGSEAQALELLHQGNAHLRSGRSPEAAAAFQAALALNANMPEAIHGLAVANQRLLRTQDAERLLREAVQRSPGNAAPLTDLGTLLGESGRLEEGLKTCRQAVDLAPDDGAAQLCLARLLAASGRHDDAARSFLHATRLRPRDPRAHEGLGWSLMAVLDAAVKATPPAGTPASARPRSGTPVVDKRQTAGAALHAFRTAFQLDPRAASAFYGAGRALFFLGRGQDARANYEASLALKPDAPAVRRALGALLLWQGDTEGGLAALRQATQGATPDAASWDALADALAEAGRGAAAAEARREARKLSPAPASSAGDAPTVLATPSAAAPPSAARASQAPSSAPSSSAAPTPSAALASTPAPDGASPQPSPTAGPTLQP